MEFLLGNQEVHCHACNKACEFKHIFEPFELRYGTLYTTPNIVYTFLPTFCTNKTKN
jgi:hypothetical protein